MGDPRRGMEMWLDYAHTLKVKVTGLANGLDMRCDRGEETG